MVAIALYRGNLHRGPTTPRRWPPPPRSLSASQFRSLRRRRSLALARVAQEGPSLSPSPEEEEQEEREEREEGALTSPSPSPSPAPLLKEEDEPGEIADADADPTLTLTLPTLQEEEEEETSRPPIVEEKREEQEEGVEQRRRQLQELNHKKHNLVQMLKQILNAEEEIKRRLAHSPAARGPPENGPNLPSANRPGPPRISVDVNFGTELGGGESDPGSTQSTHTRPFNLMHSPSPSGGALSRSPFSHTPRGPHASASLLGNPLSSPARFVPPAGQHAHASALPPLLPLPGSTFAASSPSPTTSGGTSSAFRDSRFGGSSL